MMTTAQQSTSTILPGTAVCLQGARAVWKPVQTFKDLIGLLQSMPNKTAATFDDYIYVIIDGVIWSIPRDSIPYETLVSGASIDQVVNTIRGHITRMARSIQGYAPNAPNNETELLPLGSVKTVPNGSIAMTVSKRQRGEYCDTTYVIVNTVTGVMRTLTWTSRNSHGIGVKHSGDQNDFHHTLNGHLADNEVAYVCLVGYSQKRLINLKDHNPCVTIVTNGVNLVIPVPMEETTLGTNNTCACVMKMTRTPNGNVDAFAFPAPVTGSNIVSSYLSS